MDLIPLRIYTACDWGATPVHPKFPTQKALGIVTHHTAGPNVTPFADEDAERERCFRLARAIQRAHLARGWADSGHHFLICRSGLILEGRHGSHDAARRGRCVRGAHAGNGAINSTHFGIEYEGRYDQEFLVTPDQWAAGVELYSWLAFWGQFDSQENFPHSQFRPTVCPGLLRDHLPRLRREVHDRKVEIMRELEAP